MIFNLKIIKSKKIPVEVEIFELLSNFRTKTFIQVDRTFVVLLENHGEIILFSASVWCPFFPSFSPSFFPSSSVSFCPFFHFFLFCLYFYFWLLRQQPRSKINIIFFSFQIKIVTLRKVFSPPFKQTMMTQICCIKVLFPLVL